MEVANHVILNYAELDIDGAVWFCYTSLLELMKEKICQKIKTDEVLYIQALKELKKIFM